MLLAQYSPLYVLQGVEFPSEVEFIFFYADAFPWDNLPIYIKSIHCVNSSAQGSCFHKLTADVSSG